MNIYSSKKKWKRWLAIIGIIIIALSLWYSNYLVIQISKKEQHDLIVWADAIRHRAQLVQSTESFFERLEEEERQKVEILAAATRKLVSAGDNTEDLTFYSSIILNNKTIPVIQTDEKYRIINATNIDFDIDTVPYLTGELKKEFTKYEPITISTFGITHYLFYKDSRHFTQLKAYIDDLVSDFFSEIVINSASVPVIVTDTTQSTIIVSSNIPEELRTDTTAMLEMTHHMNAMGSPITFQFGNTTNYIYYNESPVIRKLRIFPIIEILVMIVFIAFCYFLFNTSRRSEQNRVWAGLAKETAHQLGTPLSSILAWVELLRNSGQEEIAEEINKDAQRLNTIANRFSKIGSTPKLEMADIGVVVEDSINYLKKRTSNKVVFTVNKPNHPIYLPLSTELFEWVIENLSKNAIDAMDGEGSITIDIIEEENVVNIDVTDTGKGIPRSMQKNIFNPGITSKKRGWGLGLTLAERIVDEVHHGKIFVKSSTLNKGTTFRIILKKSSLPSEIND
jgi:hypothetical protein